MAQLVNIDNRVVEGIGLKSNNIRKVLGHDVYSKFFKFILKEYLQEYSMKVNKKVYLYRNKHLKYAITEFNVPMQAEHPIVIKMN